MKKIYYEWRWIVSNDTVFDFEKEIEKNFFELSRQQINQLGQYAKIFHIKPKNGKSPARHLWDCIKKIDLPF